MSVNGLDVRDLCAEISSAFPSLEMPSRPELMFHGNGCSNCTYLAQDLEQFRGKQVGGEVIRLIHQELSHLSSAGWIWVLPHYLRFCLSDEGQHDRTETEFLIYNLRPELRFQTDTARRLSLLNSRQVRCVIDFLEWCLRQEYWREFFSSDITQAVSFLRTLLIDPKSA